ncbi:MAG: hypothetical protein KGQ42_00515 [Alphaproteobacteria bacterium]|nr:hypothetical protein [Alphaproteobacteria bacterium]MDE2341199.1 hypothetical protein [Alphaproteobacteria bacterium]
MTETAQHPSRRHQHAITIRSDRAAARLQLLAKSGMSQVAIIEEALERMPLPKTLVDKAQLRARIDAILASIDPAQVPTMAEFDAATYDENGNCR